MNSSIEKVFNPSVAGVSENYKIKIPEKINRNAKIWWE